jgi:hypothetical protein
MSRSEVDAFLLDALEDFVKRQRKRLQAPKAKKDEPTAN